MDPCGSIAGIGYRMSTCESQVHKNSNQIRYVLRFRTESPFEKSNNKMVDIVRLVCRVRMCTLC